MMKTPLSSDLGQLSAFIIYALFIGAIGIILYFLIVLDWRGLIVGFVFGIYNYIIFARKLFRAKVINFDGDYFYFKDGSKIELSQIQFIKDGEITYLDNGIEKSIYVNPYFPSKNHKLFYKYFKLKK